VDVPSVAICGYRRRGTRLGTVPHAEGPGDGARASDVEDELADVLIYLVRLADVLEVDLFAVAQGKLDRNEGRFPLGGPCSTRPVGGARADRSGAGGHARRGTHRVLLASQAAGLIPLV